MVLLLICIDSRYKQKQKVEKLVKMVKEAAETINEQSIAYNELYRKRYPEEEELIPDNYKSCCVCVHKKVCAKYQGADFDLSKVCELYK